MRVLKELAELNITLYAVHYTVPQRHYRKSQITRLLHNKGNPKHDLQLAA